MLGLSAKTSKTLIYLDGTDLERDCEALMRFRLTYNGPLLSSNPLDPKKRVEHKHRIRRQFHRQLKELWATNRFLKLWKIPEDGSLVRLTPPAGVDPSNWTSPTYRPTPEVLSKTYGHDGYGFVPLVRKNIFLQCSLRILCLRRDGPDAVAASRDLDNRMKTLIDALTLPPHTDGSPLQNGKPLSPSEDEKPYFYVLLDDDRQVTHLEVETDTALEPNPDTPEDESFVRLVINVEVRPYSVMIDNLPFA